MSSPLDLHSDVITQELVASMEVKKKKKREKRFTASSPFFSSSSSSSFETAVMCSSDGAERKYELTLVLAHCELLEEFVVSFPL